MKLTARSRLETYASISRVQSDEETYDLEHSTVGSALAGVTDDRCGQCCACDRTVVPVAVGDREVGDMEMTERNQEAPTDRLRADRELLAQMMFRQSLSTGHGDTVADLVRELEPQIAELRAEVAALRADAERYRWLRSAACNLASDKVE